MEEKSSQDNTGKRGAVVVTGASSGIGLAITKLLSGSGIVTYAGVRSKEDAERLGKLDNVIPITLDVTSQEQVDAAIEKIMSDNNKLWGLVNTAGIIDFWPLAEIEYKDLRHIFEVNFFGVHRMIRAALQLLSKSKGRIVNISSIQGLASEALSGPYQSTKHALESYSETLREELQEYGILVCIVEPGGYKTHYADSTLNIIKSRIENEKVLLMKKEVKEIPDAWKSIMDGVNNQPNPDEVAQAVYDALYSDSPKRRYVVVPNAEDFEWVIESLAERMVEVNSSFKNGYPVEKLKWFIDAAAKK